MTDLHMPQLRQARPGDWEMVKRMLDNAGLPVDDLGPGRLDEFLIAEDRDGIAGLIGLDVFDDVGLLRSLVVAPSSRRAGLGSKLVGALEAAAEAAGIVELWLLTTDAELFFRRLGYDPVERGRAPDSIRATDEFSTLCPDNAHLMRKTLS